MYVLDTGILSAHHEFRQVDQHGHFMGTSRVSPIGYSAFGDNSFEDCEGHGTHVAAIIGGQCLWLREVIMNGKSKRVNEATVCQDR